MTGKACFFCVVVTKIRDDTGRAWDGISSPPVGGLQLEKGIGVAGAGARARARARGALMRLARLGVWDGGSPSRHPGRNVA